MSKYCVDVCRRFGVTGVQKLTWYHSCNSAESLQAALRSDVHMIEADLLMGSCTEDQKGECVIMAHPPHRRSNLSLEKFLRQICAYNCLVDPKLAQRQVQKMKSETLLEGVEIPEEVDLPQAEDTQQGVDDDVDDEMGGHIGANTVVQRQRRTAKGIKLDFKDMRAVKPTIELLRKMQAWAMVNCVWLNADICAGPGAPPMASNWILDGHSFLGRCCQIPGVVLSLGWISTEFSLMHGQYTATMMQDMIKLVLHPFLKSKDGITKYTVAQIAGHVTFCVQAKYALASADPLKNLLELVPGSSLTVFTGVGTMGISPDNLERIENTFDTTRLFVDVKTTGKKKDGTEGSRGADGCALM